jgi:hypothetical protein
MGGAVLGYDRFSLVDIINDETGYGFAHCSSFRAYSLCFPYDLSERRTTPVCTGLNGRFPEFEEF